MDDLSGFCCLNSECPDHGKRGAGNLTETGRYGPEMSRRMLRCRTCKTRFSERKGTPLFRSHLSREKATDLLAHIAEGCGVRQTERLVGVHRAMAFLRDPALDGQPDPARPKAHEVRFDRRAYRRDHLGAYLCNAAFLAAVALIGLGYTMETVTPMFPGTMAASSAIVLAVARRRGPYRRPQCGDLLARVITAEPAIRHDCPRCRVEWDSGSSPDPPSWSA